VSRSRSARQVRRGIKILPRAYVITPLPANDIALTYPYFSGNILFDGALPATGVAGKIGIENFTYYHSLSFLGRLANILASVPYGVGNLQGPAFGAEQYLYRPEMPDSAHRFSVILKGGPAMPIGAGKARSNRLVFHDAADR